MSLCPSLAAQWLSIGETVVHHQLCIADLVQTLSQVCGVISVSCWLCALTPQIYLNWRRKSAESLSVGFIFIWLSGDITNLVGCFLTDQLLFQKLLGCYFCFIDSVLCSQLFYYHQRQSRLERSSIEPCTPSEQSRLLEVDSLPKPGYPDSPIGPHRVRRWWRVLLGLFVAGLWATLAYHHGPALVQTWTVGDVIAWLSCILYVTSRLPQIWKNYQRQSVQGLSLFMFFFALNGNLFYFCSILLRSYVSPPGLLRKSLPYIIGSVGTVLQDCTIFAQWYRYTAQSSSNAEDSTAVITVVTRDPSPLSALPRNATANWATETTVVQGIPIPGSTSSSALTKSLSGVPPSSESYGVTLNESDMEALPYPTPQQPTPGSVSTLTMPSPLSATPNHCKFTCSGEPLHSSTPSTG